MSGRRWYSGRGVARRLIGLALVLAVCASFVPLPMTHNPAAEKDLSQPFPCQDRPCGCASAVQCWKQCCCFTNAQKVAWARKNRVTPPRYVVAAARAELVARAAEPKTLTKRSCTQCEHSSTERKANSCCDSADQQPEHSNSTCCRDSKHNESTAEVTVRVRYVIGTEMLKCHGQGLFWNSLPWAVMPVVEFPEFPAERQNWDRPLSSVAARITPEPPEPPPRLA